MFTSGTEIKRKLLAAYLLAFIFNCKDQRAKSLILGSQADVGFGEFELYNSDSTSTPIASKKFLVDLTAYLKDANENRIEKLYFERRKVFERGSVWPRVSKIRAKSYRSALNLLREYSLNEPILLSASVVVGYLKYYDDEWFAALERALSVKLPGIDASRQDIPSLLIQDISSHGTNLPLVKELLEKAEKLALLSPEEMTSYWKTDAFDFKPLSFYESRELELVWLLDRHLLKVVRGDSLDQINLFNKSWSENNSRGKNALQAIRNILSIVTNRADPALFTNDGLARLHNEDRSKIQCGLSTCVTFLPNSSQGILERLSLEERKSHDSQADGSPSIDLIINKIKEKSLTFRPLAEEGFYIYQKYALEAFLTFESNPEGKIVNAGNEIKEMWETAFKAGSVKSLETNQKAVDTGGSIITSAPSSATVIEEKIILEPLPTLYKRYALAYSFLISSISKLPKDFLSQWIVGNVPILDLLSRLELDMLSLYVLSVKQLGLQVDDDIKAKVASHGIDTLLDHSVSFLAELHNDPAFSSDQRFFAVNGRPGGPKSQACKNKLGTFWGSLGVEAIPVKVSATLNDMKSTLNDTNMILLLDQPIEFNACLNEPLNRREWQQILNSSTTSEDVQRIILENF